MIDTLEPVLNAHKLVVDPTVIKHDFQSLASYPIETQTRYSLMYQLSRLTAEKGSILQDDRLDALAMAVAYWVQQMSANADTKMKDRREELLNEELESFVNSTFGVNKSKRSLVWF